MIANRKQGGGNSQEICQLQVRSTGSYAQHRFQAALHIGLGGCPARNADAHGGLSLPGCLTAPASAILLNAADHLPRPAPHPQRRPAPGLESPR